MVLVSEAQMGELTTENMAYKPELLTLTTKVDNDASIVAGLQQATILRIQYTVTSSSQNDRALTFKNLLSQDCRRQPSPRGIQAESGSVAFQLSGPAAHSPHPILFQHSLTQQLSKHCPNSRSCVSVMQARVFRSITSSMCLRSTRPLSRNPLSR